VALGLPDKSDVPVVVSGCARGGLSDGAAGCLILVIWQQHPKGFSASPWQPSACGADAALRLDCANSLIEVRIRLPGSSKGL